MSKGTKVFWLHMARLSPFTCGAIGFSWFWQSPNTITVLLAAAGWLLCVAGVLVIHVKVAQRERR